MVRSLTVENAKWHFWTLSLLIILFFVASATLYEQVDILFYALIFWGMVGRFSFLPNSRLPRELKIEIYAILLTLLVITLGLLVSHNWNQLFEFRYQNYRDTLWVYFLALLFINYRFDAQTIWKLIVLASSYALIYSILLLIEHPPRGRGLLEVPITRGNMGMLFGVLSLLAFLGLRSKVWKALALVVMFSGVMLSLLSGSRGGWLTVILAFVTLAFLLPKLDRKLTRVIWGVIVSFTLLVFIFWHQLPIEKRILLTVNSIQKYIHGNAHTSLGYRFEMWKAAFWAFTEKPWFGWGFDSFNIYFQKYLSEGLVVGKLWGHPHNDYVLLLSEKGILGFLVVMSVLIYPFVVLIKYVKQAIAQDSLEKLYLSLTGIVLIEALMEFMLSDQTITMKFQYHTYVLLILMIMSALWFYDAEKQVD